MRNLVFIRHSQSQPDPSIPSSQWWLTKEGQRRCKPLADLLSPYNLDLIVSSAEPKASETGQLVAQRLGVPCLLMDNLHEQERETAPFFDSKAEFQEAITNLFARPTELVFGEETGLEARDRFARTVKSIFTTYPQENIAIVSHGTVLSLFASQFTEQKTVTFWQNLGMPAFVAFSYPEMKFLAQVNEIV